MNEEVFERHAVGSQIVGGMGGGLRITEIWIHQFFAERQVDSAIRAVLLGHRARIR
jgi:hypothetical protein